MTVLGPRRAGRRRRRLAGAAGCGCPEGIGITAVLVLVLSGCGDVGDARSGPAFDEVMRDPGASAEEIIAAAGPPDEVDRHADGSTMLLWRPFIVAEDDGQEPEGATAWRVYDASGAPTRTYSSPHLEDLSLTATQDGFLLTEPDLRSPAGFAQSYLVEASGERHRVAVEDDRLATRPGDTLVDDDEVLHLYRPQDRSLHPLLRQPYTSRDAVQWAGARLDERGALWVQGYEGRHHWVGWSRDGGRSLQQHTLPLLQPDGSPRDPRLALTQDVTAVLSDQVNGDKGSSTGAAYLDVVIDYGHLTQRVTAEAFPFLDRLSVDPDLSVTSDGRVLLGDRDAGEWWVAESASELEFTRLDVPSGIAYVRDLAGTLHAWGQWDHREAVLQTSTDGGTTWMPFDVSPPRH